MFIITIECACRLKRGEMLDFYQMSVYEGKREDKCLELLLNECVCR